MEAAKTVPVRAVIAFPHLNQEIMYKGASTGKFGVQLGGLSNKARLALEGLGLDVKSKEDDKYERGHFVECKSKFPLDNSGKYPVIFEDVAGGRPEPIEYGAEQIGYGTTVRAKIKAYTTQDGPKPSLVSMVIEDLVEPEVTLNEDEVL